MLISDVSQAPDLSEQLGYKNIRRITSRGRTGVENNFTPGRFSRSGNRPFFLLVRRAKMQYGETRQIDVEQGKLRGRFTVPRFTYFLRIKQKLHLHRGKEDKFLGNILSLAAVKKNIKIRIFGKDMRIAFDICR